MTLQRINLECGHKAVYPDIDPYYYCDEHKEYKKLKVYPRDPSRTIPELECGHRLYIEPYYWCSRCEKHKKEQQAPSRPRWRRWLFTAGTVFFGVLPIILTISGHIPDDPTLFFFIYFMGFTIGIILTSPIALPYHKWSEHIIGEKNTITIIQIDATVIVGAFFLLQLTPLTLPDIQPASNVTNPTPQVVDNSTGLSQLLVYTNPQIVIRSLTALTVIPFALSAILAAVWGPQIFWERERQDRRLNPYRVTGTKLATVFMISGFVWIIITMVMVSFILFDITP